MHSPTQDKPSPFDISIWRRAKNSKRESIEQNRLQTLDGIWKAIHHLSHRYQWDQIYLFGSITKPERFSQRSDIDIAVKGLNKFQHYRFISDLSERLEREIDVVRLEDCPFAETIAKRGIKWKKPE
jgi:predicted nucleotidyltransferase